MFSLRLVKLKLNRLKIILSIICWFLLYYIIILQVFKVILVFSLLWVLLILLSFIARAVSRASATTTATTLMINSFNHFIHNLLHFLVIFLFIFQSLLCNGTMVIRNWTLCTPTYLKFIRAWIFTWMWVLFIQSLVHQLINLFNVSVKSFCKLLAQILQGLLGSGSLQHIYILLIYGCLILYYLLLIMTKIMNDS